MYMQPSRSFLSRVINFNGKNVNETLPAHMININARTCLRRSSKKLQENSSNIFYTEFHTNRKTKMEITDINPFACLSKARPAQRRYIGTHNSTIKFVNIGSIRFVPNGTKSKENRMQNFI
jgi:hypothetical protein